MANNSFSNEKSNGDEGEGEVFRSFEKIVKLEGNLLFIDLYDFSSSSRLALVRTMLGLFSFL